VYHMRYFKLFYILTPRYLAEPLKKFCGALVGKVALLSELHRTSKQ